MLFTISKKVRTVLAAALILAFVCCAPQKRAESSKKVIVLGIDGLDPELLRRFMREGKMPNFASLERAGDFRLLRTSVPPQSPVAWSNLITGMDPGGHGIFDFIHRDPKTLLPDFSISREEPPKNSIRLGDWIIPLSSGGPKLLRQGKAFWEILDDHRISATLFRMPVNYPPVKSRARTLAGMGTPDISGTYGIFSFYTNDPGESEGSRSGGQVYQVQVQDSQVKAKLFGPYNGYRKSKPQAAVDFTVALDPVESTASIALGSHKILLREGGWSDWLQLKFPLVPGLESMSGICRFYLKTVRPYFQLYVTPINIDPSRPAFPLSTPRDYSRELWKKIGFYYTQGIAEDTKALSNGIFNETEFLEQARMVLAEHARAFDLELERFQGGLLFFYFSSLDQTSHMFWPRLEGGQSRSDLPEATQQRTLFVKFFEEMDRMVGKAMAKLEGDTTLMVLSDHGFAPYHRSFNLNTWLLENGYITLRDGLRQDTTDIFSGADWSRTRAYGLGLNALYLNMRGRERDGIVQAGPETESLLDEIRGKLKAVRDPIAGTSVITRVDKAGEVYSGPNVQNAPELIIGYNRGYRAGWETVLGRFSIQVLENNTERWSGDHCIDHTLVPGVLLSNRKIAMEAPALTDIAPTILSEFAIEKPKSMKGQSIFDR